MALLAATPTLVAQNRSASLGNRLLDAITGGEVGLSFRYRYEYVDDDAFTIRAYASTLRTGLSYRTKSLFGISGYLEAENVANIGLDDHHNNLGAGDANNGVTNRPVIADPPITSFNQAYLHYANHYLTATIGRHEILLDDHRFVGNVGWRQHHQTFESVKATGTWRDVTAHYAFISAVNRIFGDRLETGTHLLNAQYRFPAMATLTGYAYLLSYDDTASFNLTTNSFGAEAKGQPTVSGSWKLRFETEYAIQRNAGNNPNQLRANYVHFMAGVDYERYGIRAGWERLSGNAQDGQFNTTLATLHAFNGWADKFLVTPTDGLSDIYVRADGSAASFRAILVYHDFRPATGSGKYGREFDFQLTYNTPWDQLAAFRGALYEATSFSTTTVKIWLYTQWSF